MSRKTTPLTGSIVPKQGKTGRLAGAVSGKPLGVDVEEAELRGGDRGAGVGDGGRGVGFVAAAADCD